MKKAFYKKWWFWAIVIVLIAFVGSNSKNSGEPKTYNSNSESNTKFVINSTSSNDDTTSENDMPEHSSQTDEAYSIGTTITAKSYKLTVEALNVIESDNQFIQPDEGNVFVEVLMLIENTSNSDLNVSSILNFNAYLDGFAIQEDLVASTASKNNTINGTVGQGKKLRGGLFYQLPTNWSELEINVDLGFSSKDEISLILKNQ